MGVANSRSLELGGVPEAAHLLHAVKKGDHMKALRLLTSMPERTRAISQCAKAAAVHAAIKRGYVNMLQFLRNLPSSTNTDGTTAAAVMTSPAAFHGPVGRLSTSASRLSQQHDSTQIIRGMDPTGRQSGLERESWLNAVDRHGRTPLMTAVRYNRLEFVEGLVSLGADPWICDRATRGTALHLAASLGHAPLVAAILKSPVTGPDSRMAFFDAQDMYGFTPLHYAAAAGHANVARVLLDAGASYTASSQVIYDPAPGLRRLTSLTHIAGRTGVSFTFGTRGDSGRGTEERKGVLPAPCAPRSNPLHLAAMRGDVAVTTLVLQRYLEDTDGLTRAARERITDPRTQLNKDGFQPYMLAGNAGHWHVAQLLIPHSRDDRHHLSRNRDRDFLIFFPLPDPAIASASSGGEGLPSLTELAARVWAGKLLGDVKSAEAAVRQMQQSCGQQSSHTAALSGSVGGGVGVAPFFRDLTRSGGGGGMFGALLRRSGRFTGLSSVDHAAFGAAVAPSAVSSANTSRRGQQTPTVSSTTISVAAAVVAAATVAAASPAAVVGSVPLTSSCVVAGSSPGPSAFSTPRTSISGCGAGTATGAGGGGRAVSPPRRSIFLSPTTPHEPRRRNSLDLIPYSSGPSGTAVGPSQPSTAFLRPNIIPPGWPLSQSQSHVPIDSMVSTTAPGSPTTSVSTAAAAAAVSTRPPELSPPLCDVCFERFQELALRPCPHRMCAACCKRVVEMHCSGAALGSTNAAAARAPGRRSTPVPPRCPFCQATIRGFVPAVSML